MNIKKEILYLMVLCDVAICVYKVRNAYLEHRKTKAMQMQLETERKLAELRTLIEERKGHDPFKDDVRRLINSANALIGEDN